MLVRNQAFKNQYCKFLLHINYPFLEPLCNILIMEKNYCYKKGTNISIYFIIT